MLITVNRVRISNVDKVVVIKTQTSIIKLFLKILMNNFRLFSSLFCLHRQNYNIVSGQLIPDILQASLHQMFSCVYKSITLKAKHQNPLRNNQTQPNHIQVFRSEIRLFSLAQ